MSTEPDRNNGESTGHRDGLGRFAPGNPGRRKGTRNKATQAVLAVMERGATKLSKKAVEMALAGDPGALRLCLERLAPPTRERTLQVDLPIPSSPADVPETLKAILQAASNGEITATEAERLSRCVHSFAKVHELADFDERLRALEGGNAR